MFSRHNLISFVVSFAAYFHLFFICQTAKKEVSTLSNVPMMRLLCHLPGKDVDLYQRLLFKFYYLKKPTLKSHFEIDSE